MTALHAPTSILDYIFRELAVSYLGRDDLAEVDVTHDGLGRGAADGTRTEPAPFTEEAAQIISRGFSRGQLPDNIVILDRKRAQKLADEEAEAAELAAESEETEELNAPDYLGDACPFVGASPSSRSAKTVTSSATLAAKNPKTEVNT
jgi:ribonucleoside-diphosphate reductase alpha chain